MGDIADMMLDGTLCQQCGGLMDDQSPSDEELRNAPRGKDGLPIIESKAPGYPRTCEGCKRENRTWRKRKPKKKAP